MTAAGGKGLFAKRIDSAAPGRADIRNRRWIYVPYDQLTDSVGPMSEQAAGDTGIVMMEALAKARRRDYHKKKLVLILASQRHFALEQAERGVKVVYGFTDGIFADGLESLCSRHALDELTVMEPPEREMRLDLAEATRRGVRLTQVRNATWLSTAEDFDAVYGKPTAAKGSRHYVMDRFYRHMRERTSYLMQRGRPVGGRFSFDEDNRKPYRGEPPVPRRPEFAIDTVTEEAIGLVERLFPDNFGTTAHWTLPVSHKDVETAWRWTLKHLLPHFGPFEDAMDTGDPDLFHSQVSAYVNLARLLPRRVVEDVVEAAEKGTIPLASAEGFVRQILGWREYMRHIHRVTDGYRNVDVPKERGRREAADHGARPSALGASRPLPAAYWGVPSGLNCLDTVVRQVIDQGWSHHIQRLMVLSNFATLCGYSPRELTDWFWIAYIDAYDWVVETNVLGMATFADGGITATKPYVSGAAYIHRMSNYCEGCRYNPKRALGEDACPFTALYWSFLEQHEERLSRNPRMAMPYKTLRRKPAAERTALRERAEACVQELAKARYSGSKDER